VLTNRSYADRAHYFREVIAKNTPPTQLSMPFKRRRTEK
jgi:hypothetical protein